jgi:gamma-glutamyltranspeptidase/glutathione hydrolase
LSTISGLWATTPRSPGLVGVIHGRRGVVATVNPLATQAGLDALKAGGSAVDAAIACALTLGIVDGHNSGIGRGTSSRTRRSGAEPGGS